MAEQGQETVEGTERKEETADRAKLSLLTVSFN